MLALALATPLALLGFIFSPQVLGLFRAAPEVLAAGRHYLQLIFLGLPGFMLGMSFYSVFQATGDTRSPMLITLGTNILNLVLDPVLIFGWLGFPRLGVTGAAVATLIAQHLGLFAMAWLLAHRGMLELKGPVRRSMFRSMLGIGVPAGLQGVTRPVTGMAMFAIISGFGTAATAAFGIGLRAFEIMYIYLAGLGSAGEALVGQSLGRNDPGLAVRVTRRVTIIASLLQLVVLPLLFVFAPAVVRAFSADPAVVSAGTGYLRVLTPVLLLLGLSTAWTSAQRGAGATTVPMVAALVSNWLVKLPLAYVLAVMTRAGIIGVWLGIGASVVAETGILGVGYFAGGWKRKEVKWA